MQAPVLLLTTSPVQFEILEKQKALFKMLDSQLAIYGKQRMGKNMNDSPLPEVSCKVEHTFPSLLNVLMRFLINVLHKHVKFAAVVRKIRGHFLTCESIRQMGYLKASLNGVLIGDGDPGHAPIFAQVVEMHWIGKTFGSTKLLEDPLGRSSRKLGMQMQIYFHATMPFFAKCD